MCVVHSQYAKNLQKGDIKYRQFVNSGCNLPMNLSKNQLNIIAINKVKFKIIYDSNIED